MASEPSIDYAKLQQDAMRGVVRAVLQQIVKTGLPGEHHFYVSFLTQAPGVILSKRLREKYPTEMTIVLQHRFWDLIVSDERFEVKLTFDGIPERLVVPFSALKVFVDPSVRYGLQFDEDVRDGETARPLHSLTADASYEQAGGSDVPRSTTKRSRAPRKPRADKEVANSPSRASRDGDEMLPPSPEPATRAGEGAADDAATGEDRPHEGAKILSLDQFRKK